MRSGAWFLSACGIAGMILSVASAQERPFKEAGFSTLKPAARRPNSGVPGRFFSRGSNNERPLDSSQPVDNQSANGEVSTNKPTAAATNASPLRYQRKRSFPFGKSTETGTANGRSRNFLNELFRGQPLVARPPSSERTAGRPKLDRSASAASGVESSALRPIRNEKPLSRVPRAVIHANGDDSAASAGLRHADFQRGAGERASAIIRQTRATEENASPIATTKNETKKPAASEETPSAAADQLALPLPQPDLPRDASAQKTTVSRPARPATTVPVAIASGPQTPMVTVQWVKRGDVNVGQECHCQLHVSNSGKVPAGNLEVKAFFPESVRLTKAVPAPAEASDHLSWSFAELAPGQRQVINIHLIPSQRGELATNASVTFTAAVASVFLVNEPLLAVTVVGPEETLVGEPASQIIKVSNPGTGVATNVKLEAVVPAGLEHLRGERLAMDIGSLNPGETRVVRLALAAVKGGEQVLNVQVAADGDLREAEAKAITVIAPTLTATINGPKTRYVGRAAQYTVTVNNDSDVPSDNVRASYQVPDGYRFLRADKGGRHNAANRTVGWFIGRLEPGESAKRTVYLTAAETGDFEHNVAVTSEHGTATLAQLDATIDATASLALQFVEREDPVAVGAETAFEVRVRNDGSKPAENVGLSIELPAGVKYRNARGPSEHLAENGLLVFKSIGQLDPGKTAVYRIYVVGASAGSHRIRARVASDSISESLIGEEQTTFRAE